MNLWEPCKYQQYLAVLQYCDWLVLCEGRIYAILFLQEGILSPSEAVQLIVLPHVFKSARDEENVIPILLTLEVLYLALDCSKTADWLVTMKVPPIIYCLCDLIDSSRRKWAEQQNDSEAEQIAVVEKAIKTLDLLVEKVPQHTNCIPGNCNTWFPTGH